MTLSCNSTDSCSGFDKWCHQHSLSHAVQGACKLLYHSTPTRHSELHCWPMMADDGQVVQSLQLQYLESFLVSGPHVTRCLCGVFTVCYISAGFDQVVCSV